MKVFVSSTAYDLIDVRAEIEACLRGMGLSPVMSDRYTAEFDTKPTQNSIETCLANVRASDYVIVALNQRYGPSLKAIGFGDESATHLEYRAAVEAGKTILFYVRDRLEADFVTWNKEAKEKRPHQKSYAWVKEAKDFGLFTFLEEHRKLSKKAKRSNWISIFRDSLELKQLVQRDLDFPASQVRLESLLRTGHVPAASIAIRDTEHAAENGGLEFVLTNTGTVPLVDLRWRFVYDREKMKKFYKDSMEENDDPWHQRERWPWLSAGETAAFLIFSDIVNCPDLFRVRLDYFTITGEKVVDYFLIGVSSPTIFGNIRRYSADPKGIYKYRTKLTSRVFSRAKGGRRTVKISD